RIGPAHSMIYERETIRQSGSDHSRAARDRLELKRLASGSRDADADEQSRSGRRREFGSAHRLRRDRSGGAELGCIRYDRSLAPRIEKRRILAHSIRQARGKNSNPRRKAERSDREVGSRWNKGKRRLTQPYG